MSSRPKRVRSLVPRQSQTSCDASTTNETIGINGSHHHELFVLVGRQIELNTLSKWMEDSAIHRHPRSLYVSGPPGTGKTACIKRVLLQSKERFSFCDVYINCMGTKPKDVCAEIRRRVEEGLGQTPERRPLRPRTRAAARTDVADFEDIFVSSTAAEMIVLVLDEIDQLASSHQEFLYSAFSWPLLPKSRLCLIGVANSLDLTERLLPKLKLKSGTAPELLQFAPYSKDEMTAILSHLLREEVEDGVVDGVGLELCARKTSATSGDIRKAVDFLRQTAASPARVRVGGREVLEAVNRVYSSPVQRGTVPLQQKLLLAAALRLRSSEGLQQFSIDQLFVECKRLSERRGVPGMSKSDCIDSCRLLEAQGFLAVKSGKAAGFQVKLLVDQATLQSSLDSGLLSLALKTTA